MCRRQKAHILGPWRYLKRKQFPFSQGQCLEKSEGTRVQHCICGCCRTWWCVLLAEESTRHPNHRGLRRPDHVNQRTVPAPKLMPPTPAVQDEKRSAPHDPPPPGVGAAGPADYGPKRNTCRAHTHASFFIPNQ
jgi:hypothetical protein